MAKSKPYQEIINLGKKIAAEFSKDGRNDTTTSWMAYYLSELISEVDNEKSLPKKRKLQKECCAIIEELWKKKARFPANARPLGNLQEVIAIVEALTDKQGDKSILRWRMYDIVEDLTPWGKFMVQIRTSMEKILAISFCSAITEDALRKEKEWLEHPEMLTTLEKTAIEQLDKLISHYDHYLISNFINTTDAETISEESPDKLIRAINKLKDLIDDEQKCLDDLKKQIIKNDIP